MRVYVETFGCQMNQLESELVLGTLARQGYVPTDRREEADVLLYNTCSVREHAEDRALSHVGQAARLKRKKPSLIIGVVGCMAKARGREILERLPHVDLVVGPRQLGAIPRFLREISDGGGRRVAVEDFDEEFIEPNHIEQGRRTRFQAYIKVMEGCDLNCTFCIVPRTRGREVSRPPEEIVEETRRLAGEGVVEITLLGQTVNSYGKGLRPHCDLAGLLERLEDVPGLRRIRFITSHPIFMKPRLIRAMATLPKVVPYLHLPVQSGSDRILARMKRRYTRARYLEIVSALREAVPHLALATDWIVGFPGETESDFDQSAALMEEVRFAGSFIFKYSPRPQTEAMAMSDDVPEEIKQRRNQELLRRQERISREIHRSRIGAEVEVLVEGPSKRDPKKQTGRTERNEIVCFESDRDLRGRFVRIRITDATSLTLFGTPVPAASA